MLSNQEKVSPYDQQRALLTVMRNSRLRTFVYVMVIGAMCCTIYMLSATHSQLKDVESAHDKCLQQRDSLSAQLQVVYEHKNRLEKSLQQEKVEHKLTKEENDKQRNEIHVRLEREKHTLESRYNNLFQEHETLKNKQQQLNEEIANLKDSLSLQEREKKQLVAALSAQLDTVKQQKDEETGKLTEHINHLLQEKDDLQKNNENLASRALSHENELHLCHLQYQKLEGKYNHLKLQIDNRLSEDIREAAIMKQNQQQNIDRRESDQHKQQSHVDKKNNDQSQGLEKGQQVKHKNEDDVKRQQSSSSKIITNKHHDDGDEVARPNLLPRPNLVVEKFIKKENQDSKVLSHFQQDEDHLGPKVLERPAVRDPENLNIQKANFHSFDAGNNVVDSKVGPAPDRINSHSNIKPVDFLHNEEHLPQVQPPHSFDKVDGAGNGAESDHWDKYRQIAHDPFQSKMDVNNHVLPQPFNVREPSPQNVKQQGSDDAQEHGVLIKPPLQGNWAHKQGQNIEGLKRGPQMIEEKNGRHRQQEEDGDYAEDGDDDNADDQDAEANDDDQLMVGEHGHGKVFQDTDFDDQENAEQEEKNAKNQEKEEGVMVAPK